MTHQWYALYTKPKAEYKVATALERVGVEIFLPEIHVKKKNKIVKEPFFPCYLFMAAKLQEIQPSAWIWTPGLRRIVAYGNQPVRLSPEVIRLIKSRLDELNSKRTNAQSDSYFTPGDKVRITDGPLSDMVAIFEGPTTPEKRVHVLLAALDHQRRVRLSVTDLEKVPDSTPKNKKRPRRTRGRGRRIKN